MIGTLAEHTRDVQAIAITPNGKILVSGGGDTVIKLWDLGTGKVVESWSDHADAVNAIALSPDGKRLISCSADKTVKVWSMPLY